MSNTSMPANFLKRTALPSITGLQASAPMLPRPEHRGAVRDHRDQVAARGVVARGIGVGVDLLAGGGDAGRIGQREVALGRHALGRLDRELPRPRQAMIIEPLQLCEPYSIARFRLISRNGNAHAQRGAASSTVNDALSR